MARSKLEKIINDVEQLPINEQLEMASKLIQMGKFKVANAILKKTSNEFAMYVDHGKAVTRGVVKTYQAVSRQGWTII